MGKAIKVVVRDYWNKEFSHRPYQMVLHNNEDKSLSTCDVLGSLLESVGARDGDEVEVCVTITGARPFGNRRWCLQSPNKYGPEVVKQEEKAAVPTPQTE